MLTLPAELIRPYETQLAQHGVLTPQRTYYLKWLRYYWDFCHKYALVPSDRKSFPPFDEKLRSKGQSDSQRQQAYHAIELYYEVALTQRTARQPMKPSAPIPNPAHLNTAVTPVRSIAAGETSHVKVAAPVRIPHTQPRLNASTAHVQPIPPVDSAPVVQEGSLLELVQDHSCSTGHLRETGASWVEVVDAGTKLTSGGAAEYLDWFMLQSQGSPGTQ